MSSKLIMHMQRLQGWRLITVVSITIIVTVEIIVSVMSLILNGAVIGDYLLTGIVAAVLVAPLSLAFVNHIIDTLAQERLSLLESHSQRAERRLSAAIAAAQMVFWEFDLVNDRLIFEESELKYLGVDNRNAAHNLQSWLANLHPDDQTPFMQQFLATAQPDGPQFDFEYRIKQSDGRWGWVHTRGSVIQRDANGGALWAAGGSLNIDVRKAIEEQLRSSETLLRSTLESTDEGILMIGHDGRVLSVNKRFHELWRIPKEVANTGRDDLLLGHVLEQLTDQAVFLDQVQRLYDSDEEARDILHFKDGRVFARFTQALRINQERGRIWCFKDITEQHHAESELRQSDQRFRTLFDSSPDPIWIIDGHRFVECNQAAVDMLGYPNKDALCNTHPSELSPKFQPDGEASFSKAEQMMDLAQKNGLNRFEWVHQRKDGSEFYAEVTLSPITLQNRPAIYCVWRNITARKNVETELRAIKERYDYATSVGKVGTWDWNPLTGVLAWSDETFRLMGYAPGSVIPTYELYLGLVHPDDRAFLNESVQAALQKKKQYALDCRIILGNRDEIVCHVTGKVEFDANDQPVRMLGTIQDITERKKAESELRTGEERLRLALHAANQGWFDLNLLTGTISVSEEYARMLGYDPQNFHTDLDNWISGLHPDDRAGVLKEFRECVELGSPRTMQYRRRKYDGEWIWLSSVGKVVEWDMQGKPKRMIGIHTNITEFKLAELSLETSRNLLKTIIDTSPMRVFWKDRDLRYLGCNPAFAKDAGKSSPEEMLGKDDSEMAWGAQAELYRADDRQVMDSGIAKLSYDEPQTTPDGSTIWLRTSKVPLRNDGGETIGLLGIYEDITARKLSEHELIESEERFRQIFNTVSEAIFIHDADSGAIIDVNQPMCDLYGLTREEAKACGPDDLSAGTPPYSAAEAIEKFRKTLAEGTQTFEWLARARTGRIFWAEVTLRFAIIGKHRRILAVVRDISERKRTEETLLASEERARTLSSLLRLITDNVTDMIWAKDLNKRFLFANKAICNQLLNARDTDEPIGKDDMFFAMRERNSHPDNPGWHTFGELCQDSDTITLQCGKPSQFDEYGNVQGKFLFLDVHKAPFINDKGEVIGVVGSGRDVTQQKVIEEKLRLASMVLENSSEAMFITDAQKTILEVNPAFTLLTGYSAEDVIGKNPRLLRSGRHDAAFYRTMQNALETTGHWQGEVWNRRKNGEVFAEWQTINTIYNTDGSIRRHVALFSDITEKKKSEELIWAQANFDQLTGLPNRRMFRDRLSQDLKKAHRAGHGLALMFLDLDHFKEVNDSLGHDTGDALLIEAAQRIAACVRESDTVARLGGDEFTIILAELDDRANIERIAAEILRSLSLPFELGENIAYVSASIGITLYPDDATSLEDMLKNADQAMYVAKSAGRDRFSYFTNAMQESALYRLHMLNDLRRALAEQQFQLHYQPIVDIPTGRVHKAEALLRWFHPIRGYISPAEFIPLAEESGLIHEIGDWVFEQAAAQAQTWADHYGSDFQISVNKSPVQIQAKAERCRWKEHLAKTKLSGKNLVIEITEGVLLNNSPAVVSELLSFRDAGIQVAIDDFGTGYSSLSYLKKLDIDYVKIDQSFILHLQADDNDKAVAEAIVVMAHKLGLKVIAEGVETPQQLNLLTKMGCDYAQGFLYSRAVAPQEFEQLLADLAK